MDNENETFKECYLDEQMYFELLHEMVDVARYLMDALDIGEEDAVSLVTGGYRSCKDIVSRPQHHLCEWCRFDEVKAAGIYAAAKVIADAEDEEVKK